MLSNEKYEQLLNDVKKEFPDFKIVKKSDSFFMKMVSWFLRIVSFGKLNSFMKSFTTTIGQNIYVAESWDTNSLATKAITIRHERIHMRQARDVGRIKFSLLYLFVYFPIGFAYYRAKFEKEAYAESLRAVHEYYGPKFFTQSLKDNVVKHFTSAEYLWMWPKKEQIEEWYDVVVKEITSSKNHS